MGAWLDEGMVDAGTACPVLVSERFKSSTWHGPQRKANTQEVRITNGSDHKAVLTMRPLITVCIPAYNRAGLLAPLLESILGQECPRFNVLVCEDGSPERPAIGKVVRHFQQRYPGQIRYEENAVNLGYDGNIRRLVEKADGQFCLFMGNDDVLCVGALTSVAAAIRRNPDCGVVVRSYASFEDSPDVIKQVFRYFPEERTLAAGAGAVCTAFRRSVVISGMVIHRDAAAALSTDRFDGTLLYQLYLVGTILARRSVVFIPEVIALRRDGTPPDFGNSESERGRFVPHDQTPESSIHFMRGMLAIAMHLQEDTRLNVFSSIRSDIGNYAYPVLAIQAKRPLSVFVKYGLALAREGLWRYPLFYVYFAGLLVMGPDLSNKAINFVKQRLGHTPRFGVVRDER